MVIGAAVGVAIGFTELARRSFFPLVLLLYGLPQVTLMPLFILVFGLGPPSRIAFGFTHGVLPIIVTTVAGMRAVNPLFIARRAFDGASRAQILRHIIFPHMVAERLHRPAARDVVDAARRRSWRNCTFRPTASAASRRSSPKLKSAPLFALILVLAVIAIALNELVGLAETR